MTLLVNNLLVYSDSRSLPRMKDGIRFEDTFVGKLQNDFPTYLRGWGGITSTELTNVLQSDAGYFTGAPNVQIVLFFGVVDGSPQPITYHLKRILNSHRLRNARSITSRFVDYLEPRRAQIQKLWSFRRTEPREFASNLDRIKKTIIHESVRTIVLLNPLPPIELEERSPGFRQSIIEYNSILEGTFRNLQNVQVVPMANFHNSYYVSLHDGHHLSILGHEYTYQLICDALSK